MNANVIVNGKQAFEFAMRVAPEATLRTVRGWLLSEKSAFLGSKKGLGTFGRELTKKQRKYPPIRPWSKFVGRAFGGRLENEDSIDKMQLRMGLRNSRRTKIPWIETLAKGGTIKPGKAKYLLIPNYENLLSVGLYGRLGGSGKNTFAGLFRKMFAESRLNAYWTASGKMLVFADNPDKGGSHQLRHQHALHGKLIFTGVRSVKVQQKFDFEKSWNKRRAGLVDRGQKRLARMVAAIEQGKVRVA